MDTQVNILKSTRGGKKVVFGFDFRTRLSQYQVSLVSDIYGIEKEHRLVDISEWFPSFPFIRSSVIFASFSSPAYKIWTPKKGDEMDMHSRRAYALSKASFREIRIPVEYAGTGRTFLSSRVYAKATSVATTKIRRKVRIRRQFFRIKR